MSDYIQDTIRTSELVVRAERHNMLNARLADSVPEDTSFVEYQVSSGGQRCSLSIRDKGLLVVGFSPASQNKVAWEFGHLISWRHGQATPASYDELCQTPALHFPIFAWAHNCSSAPTADEDETDPGQFADTDGGKPPHFSGRHSELYRRGDVAQPAYSIF